jgi:tetratricopeptide (TPR) repeat protein
MGKHMNFHNEDDPFRELTKIMRKLLKAQKRLKLTKEKAEKIELKALIDSLKMDLGWKLLDYGENEKGLALFMSVSKDGNQERKICGVSRALTDMGYYNEALKLLMNGLRKFRKSCNLWTGCGIVNNLLGNGLQALRCFEAAIEFGPKETPELFYNKASALVNLRRYKEAIPILDQLIEHCPGRPMYLAERGECSLNTGYPYEALRYYQKALDLLDKNPEVEAGLCIYAGLSATYIELGMGKEAMEIALEGISRYPDKEPCLYYNLASALMAMGRKQEAREVLESGIKRFPESENLKMLLIDLEDMDDPHGGTSATFGILLLVAWVKRRLRRR